MLSSTAASESPMVLIFYAYASLGELAFPVHCGGEADIRQVLPALAFQEGFACTPSQLPMGAKTDNRHRPAIAVIGRSVMARWAAASRSGAPAPLGSTTPPQFLAAGIAKGSQRIHRLVVQKLHDIAQGLVWCEIRLDDHAHH